MANLQDQQSSEQTPISQPFNPISTPLSAVSLIEASAGTGKTHSIVSLYIRLLLQAGENNFPQALEVNQILVVTFTEMATQELKQRIGERISQTKQQLIQYEQHQDKTLIEDQFTRELLPYIQDIKLAIYRLTLAEQNLDISAISTIHSFCRQVLMQYAFNSGVHFNMELVTDETDLIKRLANELWRENFYQQPLFVANFIFNKLGSPNGLVSEIEKKYLTNPPKVNTNRPHLLEGNLQQFLKEKVSPQLEKINGFKQRWLEYEQELKDLVAAKKWRKDWFESRFNKMQAWARNLENFQQPDPAKYFYQSELAKKEPEVSHALFAELESLAANEIAQMTNNVSVLLYHCMQELSRKVLDYKVTHQQKGFDDLLRLVREALYQPQGQELAQLIRHQYPFAMIDEFQDTDQQQYDIFKRIYMESAEGNSGFIMIGDPKQSIYKFRGADIFTYLKATENAQHQFNLGENWRSTQPLIQIVNHLFDFQEPFLYKKIKFQQIAKGLNYDEQGNLIPHQFLLNGKVEPALRCYMTDGNDDQLAENCALSIEQWLQSAVVNQAVLDNKPLRAKNIAVLVSSFSQAEKIQKALREKGIASVYLSDRSNVFDSITAKELLFILRACLNPLNENNILNALSTALFAKTSAEIFQIKQNESLWEDCVERFIAYQQQWQKQGILPMLHHLFNAEKINENLQLMAQGERKMTDLWHLSELLQQAARLNDTEAALLRWFEKQIQGEDRLEEQIRLESDRELVKIVTLHKSKGLAYDLVWLPFICKPSRFHDNSISTYYDEDKEQVLWDMDKQHSEDIEKERMAEDIRLLYVALTRAKYQIVVNLPTVFDKKWNALLYVLSKGKIGINKSITEYDTNELLTPMIEQLGDKCIFVENAEQLLAEQREHVAMEEELQPVTAEEFHGWIERDWTVTSFTEITYRHQRNKALHAQQKIQSAVEVEGVFDQARDYDFKDNKSLTQPTSSDVELNVVSDYPAGFSPFDFPHGTHIGTEIHRYFEKYNMEQALNEEHLSKLCQALQLSDEWQISLHQWIKAIFNTPLIEGDTRFTLGNIKQQDCLKEMQFYLKLNQRFNQNAFNQLLHKYHHLPSAPLLMESIQGMVRGFIDLVVRFEGKYYLLDYKSNLLGNSPRDYEQDNLSKAMSNSHYDWQYLIYTIALHRYLKERDKNYDYERDFGGVIYTFLRGMNGKDSSGVFFDKPDWRLISELESLF